MVNTPDFGSGIPRSNRGGATKALWRNRQTRKTQNFVPYGYSGSIPERATKSDRAVSRER